MSDIPKETLSASRETERLMRSKKFTKTPRASKNAMRHRLRGTLEALGSVRGKEAPKNREYQIVSRRGWPVPLRKHSSCSCLDARNLRKNVSKRKSLQAAPRVR